MQKVLDNINANIFVSDYDTLKVIFANKPFREEAGEVPENAECWRMLNAGLENGTSQVPASAKTQIMAIIITMRRFLLFFILTSPPLTCIKT